MKVMGIPNCSTYKKAVNWFVEHGIAIETVNLKEHPPSKEELKEYHLLSKGPLKKFFNTSGKLYRELDLKHKRENMSNDEVYELLSKHPMLIKRPLVVDGDYVRTGFKEEDYKKQWL